MQIEENIHRLRQSVPAHVSIVAVSKTVSETHILDAYRFGLKAFGENRVQELIKKQANLPGEIEWHMIGHLQSNKVKYIAPFITMIHAVDNLKLLSVINQEALKNNRIIPCLLQIRIAKEETKFGMNLEDANNVLSSAAFQAMKNINVAGLMGMATFTQDTSLIRSEFRYLAECFKQIKADYFGNDESFCELSMGMSSDYTIAIEEGATLIRIGSFIFGART
ncbi:MAG: YggS family pyridoxal phosphate-dependent enzyme [Bacteroidales bacterium]|nr:YggS family pyridoxal phosphate-dependent enzyme [Bacteroidales bacterium]